QAAKLDFKNVAFASLYYPDAADAAAIDQAYIAKVAEGGPPSRGLYDLAALPGGIKVELTFIGSSAPITRLFPQDRRPDAIESPASLVDGTLYSSAATAPGDTVEAQM